MKRFKRLAALALSAVMAVGMMIPAGAMRIQHNITGGTNPSQVGYGNIGSITVMDVPENTTLTAYRLFDMPADDAFTLFATSPWYQFFSSGEGSNYVDLEEIELEYSDGTKETAYLVKAKDNFTDKTAQTLAKAAMAYLAGISVAEENKVTLNPLSESENIVPNPGAASSTTFMSQSLRVPFGYYLIDTEMGSLCSVTSANPNAFVYDKSTRPSVFKEVWTGIGRPDVESNSGWSSSNDATIGDTVWFRITLNPATALNGGTVNPDPGPDDGNTYTIYYVDGVEGVNVFSDQGYEHYSAGDATPAFSGDPNQYVDKEYSGHSFQGWSPAVNPVVSAGDATSDYNTSDGDAGTILYTATWQKVEEASNTDTAEAAETYSAASYSASSYALNRADDDMSSYALMQNSQIPTGAALTLSDTMDSGLTFNRFNGIEAYLITEEGTYPLNVDGKTAVQDVTIGYTRTSNGIQIGVAGTADKNSQIVIIYSATLNSNAVVGTGGNENKVELLQKGSLVGSASTITYTYAFDLVKIDGDNKVLDGAVFQLYYKGDRAPIAIADMGNGVYRVEEIGDLVIERAMVNQSPLRGGIQAGKVTIEGLGSGTYILREVQAPSGYNRAPDQEFTVDGARTITVGGNSRSSTATVQNGVYQDGGLAIVNLRGIELPHTGGMGTTLFYVVGGVLVVGAGILLIVKKRMKNEE